MYKLLIVDDEKIIREGMKKIIPWNDFGVKICGEAEDGKEALKLVDLLQPDIIFTDIKMPNMDGIELLKALREKKSSCKVVILSGYDDFLLVRQAMKYGAIDYLLKPSRKEEIIQLIEEITENIEDELNSQLKNSESLYLLKTNVLGRMVHGIMSGLEFQNKMNLLDLPLPKGACAIALVEILQGETDSFDEFHEDMIGKTFDVCNTCEKLIEKKGIGLVFTDTIGKIKIVLTDIPANNTTLYVKTVLETIIHSVGRISIAIGVGNVVGSYRRLKESYQKAAKSLEYQFVFGKGVVLQYSEIQEYFSERMALPEVDGTQLKEVLLTGDKQKIALYIQKMFEEYNAGEMLGDRFLLRNYAMEIVVLAYQSLDLGPIIDRQKVLTMKENALRCVAGRNSLNLIEETLVECLYEISDYINKRMKSDYSKIVFDTIRCIEESYSDPELSLQLFADEFSVNAAYLGRVFKHEVKRSFSDYLTITRIEAAKKLLLNTNVKGSELFEKVGFSNYNYFYIVFKKVTGQKPSDFRK